MAYEMNFNDEEIEELHTAPVHQDRVFVIMWQSSRSGGTYTELRKSVQGKNRFLSALHFMGVDMKSVQVFEQHKVWVPEPKSKRRESLDGHKNSGTRKRDNRFPRKPKF